MLVQKFIFLVTKRKQFCELEEEKFIQASQVRRKPLYEATLLAYNFIM